MQKSKIEGEYKDYFQQLFPQKKIDILYFNPIIPIKLRENRILIHSFKNRNDNYFQIIEGRDMHYYTMNKIEIDKNMVDKIEKNNKKEWKMNIYLKLS